MGYNHFRPAFPSGYEWCCIGMEMPPMAYMQGPEALRLLIASRVSAWNHQEDWTDRPLFISRHQWAALGVQHLSYNSTVKVPIRYLKSDRTIQVLNYYFQPRAISQNGFVPADINNSARTDIPPHNVVMARKPEPTTFEGPTEPLPPVDPIDTPNTTAPIQHLSHTCPGT